MAWQIEKYQLLGGINQDDSEDSVQPFEVVDAGNFLFDRQQCYTRPGIAPNPVFGITDNGAFLKSFRYGANPLTVMLGSQNTLWYLSYDNLVNVGRVSGTQITGPAFTTDGVSSKFASVNTSIIVSGIVGGMLHWTPFAATYTQMTTAKYRYVTGLNSRALAAYDIGNGNAAIGSKTVAWSNAGDETNWTAGGSSSAGTAILSDAPDDITGTCVIRNVWVIVRRSGFHLGTVTNSALPVFSFQPWSRDGVGCNWPNTLDVEDNVMAFVGPDDVYTFDLVNLTPIGKEIRNELIQLLDTGYQYRGFFSRSSKSTDFIPSSVASGFSRLRRNRWYYHLVPAVIPFTGPDVTENRPHYVYDMQNKKWSRHFYDNNSFFFPQSDIPITAFNFIMSNQLEAPCLVGQGFFYPWNPSIKCETNAYLLGKVMPVAEQSRNYRCNRVLLRHRNTGVSDPISMTVFATMDESTKSTTDTRRIGTVDANGRWMRSWFNHDVTGQDFQVRIDIPAGNQFSTNFCELHYSDIGEYKGVPSSYTDYTGALTPNG